MLSFEIGQRESGFYSERTESQTDRITEPSSTVLVYRLQINLGILQPVFQYAVRHISPENDTFERDLANHLFPIKMTHLKETLLIFVKEQLYTCIRITHLKETFTSLHQHFDKG